MNRDRSQPKSSDLRSSQCRGKRKSPSHQVHRNLCPRGSTLIQPIKDEERGDRRGEWRHLLNISKSGQYSKHSGMRHGYTHPLQAVAPLSCRSPIHRPAQSCVPRGAWGLPLAPSAQPRGIPLTPLHTQGQKGTVPTGLALAGRFFRLSRTKPVTVHI